MSQTGLAPTNQIARHSGQDKQPRGVSGYRFDSWLENWQEFIRREQTRVNKLCEMSVTLHRRFRGLTLSDMCGRYGVLQNTQGRWLDWDPDADGEIHPINIVQPAIRATTNACLQSNPQINVTSANASAKHKQIALRWERIADYFHRTGMTEELRGLMFDAVQKDGTILICSYAEKYDKQTVDHAGEKRMGVARFECADCGQKGMTETDGQHEEGQGNIPCPKCGGNATAELRVMNGFAMDQAELDTVEIKNEIIPFFNFTIDRYGAKLGGIKTAKWLQIQKLADQVEMETKYGRKDLAGPANWCYQLQCDWALANADWRYLQAGASQERLMNDFERYEDRTIYLHEEAYKTYVSPSDYEFVNAKRQVRFTIKEGQTIGEAFTKMYGENPRGLAFAWGEDLLLDILSPEDEEINFREKFSDVHWLRDSGSYLSSPYYSIVVVQDDITLLNTMNHNIIARNAVNPVYFDSLVFNEQDFTREFIPSKNSHMLPDRDINKAAMQLPVPTPSPHLQNQLQFLWEIKDSITQVQPALRGEQQKGETYGAQRQQLEQSYGMLTSVLKSYAQALQTMFKQKARIASKKWTLEQFQRVGSMFGEIWTDEDVTEMCEIDFDRDLIVSYAAGSEMPQSNLDREMKFVNGLQQLLQIPPEVLFQSIGPDKVAQILKKIDEFAEFDFDLTGLETDEMVAQKRYIELSEICISFGEISFDQIDLAKQTVVGSDEMGMPITQLDLMAEQIFYKSKIRFSKYENLEQQNTFFIEQLRVETGKTKPNYLLLEMLNVMIGMVEMAITQMMAEQQQQAMMNDPAVQMQLAQEEQARADEQANAEREDKGKAEERAAAEESEARQFEQQSALQGQAANADMAKTALQGAIQIEAEKAKPKPAKSKR